jgi:hypothetical protein
MHSRLWTKSSVVAKITFYGDYRAYVQLMLLFDHIEDIIRSERRSRLLHRAPGYGDESIAIDIYIYEGPEALKPGGNKATASGTEANGQALGASCRTVTLIYSGEAEAVV